MEDLLVTGGAGFIGSHTAAYYADQGADVTVLDNKSRSDHLQHSTEATAPSSHNWEYLRSTYPEVELVQGDIRDSELVMDLVAGCDGIVHTAGQVAVTTSLEDPVTDFETNARGTLNILEASRKAVSDPTVIVASTNKVYGENLNGMAIREKETRYASTDPAYAHGVPETSDVDGGEHTPYGVSKLAADLYTQDYAARGAIDAAAFRMSCIYGPRQFGNEDQGWVAHFVRSALDDEQLTIYGDGKQVRDVLYVEDLIRAYDAFLSDPAGKPSVYNIGGGPNHTTSLLELLDLIEEKTGHRPSIRFDEWREGDQKIYVSDVSRAREYLDWEPKIGLETGIQRFIDWYRERSPDVDGSRCG